MELCVHDKTTANPSSADIVQAIDARPHPADWYLVLESDESFIDAGELADEELYAADAQWSGLHDRMCIHLPDETERRLELAATCGLPACA